MPFDYRIDTGRQLGVFRGHGALTTAEFVATFVAYTRDDSFDPEHVMLMDLRAVTTVHSSFNEILSRAYGLKPVLAVFTAPVQAVIHAPDSTVFGMARILQQVVEPISHLRVSVHAEERDALRQAGRTETSFDALQRPVAP